MIAQNDKIDMKSPSGGSCGTGGGSCGCGSGGEAEAGPTEAIQLNVSRLVAERSRPRREPASFQPTDAYPQGLMIGLDVGSTTVKFVVVDPVRDEILFKDYQRHDTRQPEKCLEMLEAIEQRFADVPARAVAGAHCPRPDEPTGPAVSAPRVRLNDA